VNLICLRESCRLGFEMRIINRNTFYVRGEKYEARTYALPDGYSALCFRGDKPVTWRHSVMDDAAELMGISNPALLARMEAIRAVVRIHGKRNRLQ
jgi:hypothetical protein